MPQQLILYLPVIHQGYDRLLTYRGRGAEVLLLGRSFADDYPVIRKDIRALQPERAAKYILAAQAVAAVRVVEKDDLPGAVSASTLVLPDEDLMHDLADRYGLRERAVLDFEPTFLRWDRVRSKADRLPSFDRQLASDDPGVQLMRLALATAVRSTDWWRQVGALAVRDGELLASAHNEHLPTPYSPYVDGDPRSDYSRGVRIDLSTALHAEAAVVGECARQGISLDGAELFVSTFPCPPCARLVAVSGFRRCFYAGGYSMLDAEEILRGAGIELIYVAPD